MTYFIAAIPQSDNVFKVVGCDDPADALRSGGQASPIYGAFGQPAPLIPQDGAIVMFFAADPQSLLRTVQIQKDRTLASNTFVTHGLASVGFVTATIQSAQEIVSRFSVLASSSEIWPISQSFVGTANVQVPASAYQGPREGKSLDVDGLPFEAETHVAQLNNHLAQLERIADLHAPELNELIEALAEAGQTAADAIRDLNGSAMLVDIQERHQHVSTLVEINAGLAMTVSQAASGVSPILREQYSVGEYSLFGVGSAWRAVWRLYRFLSTSFESSAHIPTLAHILSYGTPFDPFAKRNTKGYEAWAASNCRLSRHGRQEPHPQRLHSVYYSSRQGFHETLFTMSASWQVLKSGASREWNLLTLSHELVHAHVRDIMTLIFDDADFDSVRDAWVDGAPPSVSLSFQLGILSSLRFIRRVQTDLPKITADADVINSPGWTEVPSSEDIERLAEGPARRYAHEVFVHVLDFLYVYDGDEEKYTRAIWGSWAHVPLVSKRIHHYVLRTLCALSSLPEGMPTASAAFRHATDRLETHFDGLLAEGEDGVVRAALEYLRDRSGRRKLKKEFEQAYYLVRLVRVFLYDPESPMGLLTRTADDIVDERGAGTSIAVGDYRLPIGSPTAFLLDQYNTYSSRIVSECEFRSLWQLLLLSSWSNEEDPNGSVD